MKEHDGSISFSVDVDNEKALKKLGQLEKEIEKTKRDIEDMTDKRKNAEKMLPFKLDELEKAQTLLQELEAELRDIKAAADDTNLSKGVKTEARADRDQKSAEVKAQREKVGSLQKQYDNLVSSVKEYDIKLETASERLGKQETKAGKLVEKISLASKKTIQMEEANKMAEAREKAKASADKWAAQVESAFGTAMSKVRSAISATAERIVAFGKRIVAVAKNLNVFSRLSSSLAGKLKRLGSAIKSALIFSTLYQGLAYVRQQIGAYIKVNDEFMNALGRLKGAFLTAFQPIYSAAMPALTALLNTLTKIISAISQLTSALFGTTAKDAQKNAKALYEQASALNATGGAAEKAAGSLAGFDEINTLASNKSSGGGGSTAGAIDFGVAMSGETFDSWGNAFNAFLDRVLTKGIEKLRESLSNLATWMNNFSENLYEMFTFPGIKEKIILLGYQIADAFNVMVLGIDWSTLGAALGAGLNLAILFAVSLIYNFDWLQLGNSIAQALNGAIVQIDWYAVGQFLWAGFKIAIETLAGIIIGIDAVALAQAASELVIGFVNSISQTLEKIDWGKIGEQIVEFLTNLDWEGMAISVFEAIGNAFEAGIDFLFGVIIEVWDKVVEWWHDASYEDGEYTIEGWMDGAGGVIEGIYNWLKQHIVDPIVKNIKKLLGIHSPSKVMAEIGEFTMQGMLDGLSSKTEKVKELFSNLWRDIKNWYSTNVSKYFTLQYWKDLGARMIDGLMNGLSGIFGKISAWASDVWNSITNGISGNALASDYGISVSSMPTSTAYSVPALARGAVIPPNREFMAILGDQTSGTNIETPEALLRRIVREEAGDSDTLYVLRDILAAIREGKNIVVDKRVLGKVTSEAITQQARASGKAVVTA